MIARNLILLPRVDSNHFKILSISKDHLYSYSVDIYLVRLYDLFMGYHGMLEKKIKVQELRRKGFSYREILKTIPVSKDTISRWCRDIKLNQEQLRRLYENRNKGGLKGGYIGAKKQQDTRIRITSQLLNQGVKDIGGFSRRDRFIFGTALYLAEGTKADRRCEFTNADPRLIKFMTQWFREFCEISPDRLRGAIWLHEGLNENKAKSFWSKLTGIPIENFHKTYIAQNKKNSRKVRKNIHEHGIFSLRFYDASIHRKMMGWIAGTLRES